MCADCVTSKGVHVRAKFQLEIKSFSIVTIWESLMLENGACGAGFFKALDNSGALMMTFSEEELLGSGVLCGKQSTQSESHSPLVLVT